MTKKMTPTIWRAEQAAQFRAGQQADALIRRLGLSYSIDPLQVARDELPRLRVGGRNFANRFDGKLKYLSKDHCFALMYNTKYDVGLPDGTHHPRTRSRFLMSWDIISSGTTMHIWRTAESRTLRSMSSEARLKSSERPVRLRQVSCCRRT